MNCDQLQERLLAVPTARDAEVTAHLAECAGCRAFVGELDGFEVLLRRALEVPVPPRAAPVPDAAPATVVPLPAVRRSLHPARWFALAASVAAVAVLAAALLTFYPRAALSTALVGHMSHEPDSWAVTPVAVPDGALAYVLGRSGVRLAAGAAQISYAHSCWFRGWFVPHLVVQTGHGPMTVMVLRHEHVTAATPIDEGGYRGVIVPAGRGSIAVLSRSGAGPAEVDSVAARVAAAVTFTG